jgi:diadenosine tetraphosphate (Ap4A) HIT family hydrolase
MKQNIFSNKESFRQSFEQGLVKLLDYDELGVFILVLANSSFDLHVHNYTEQALLTKYHQLCRYYRHAIKEGQQLQDPEDDLLVFFKLLAISIDNIRQTEFRNEETWEMQFNHLRSMKPARVGNHKVCIIQLDYDADGFNFNKPFMQKEIFWDGELLGKPLSIFYNKFPFVRFHSLLVPDKEAEINQFLTPQYHQYIWDVAKYLSATLPGLGIAYNSYGAFCSVNHLHFHLFIKEHPLPIMNHKWKHNGGEIDYPLQCKVFTDHQTAWEFIDKLHHQHIAYNLIYQQNNLYCIVRKHQCQTELPTWSGGIGWYEVSGGFTTFNHDDFKQMKENELNNTLSALKIDLQ